MTDISMGKCPTFRFKRFELSNSLSAMKVGTDGVMLGAWARVDGVVRAWDVGCGTGLIALMLVQRAGVEMTAVDIDAGACREASYNVASSPWPDAVKVVHGDVTRIWRSLPAPDLIVSNPPYFANSLKAPDDGRSMARHEGTLTYASLVKIAASALTEHGRLCMVSPADRRADIEWECMMNRLYVRRITEVCSVKGRDAVRLMWEVSRDAGPLAIDRVDIRSANNVYSDEYRSLTGDFYLEF